MQRGSGLMLLLGDTASLASDRGGPRAEKTVSGRGVAALALSTGHIGGPWWRGLASSASRKDLRRGDKREEVVGARTRGSWLGDDGRMVDDRSEESRVCSGKREALKAGAEMGAAWRSWLPATAARGDEAERSCSGPRAAT